MATISLAKLLRKQGSLSQILNSLIYENGNDLCILDADSRLLFGQTSEVDLPRYPVIYEEETVGWVTGHPQAASVAALLEFVLTQEGEKKSLANELIGRYRELNLLYHLSERMAVFPHPEAIANVALDEITRLIPAVSGMILLDQASTNTFKTTVACGTPYQMAPTCCLIERVLETGKAELANAVSGDEYFIESKDQRISLMCAPLKNEKGILGLIILVGDEGRTFTAGELKLLNTVALQVAPAIEVTRLHQIAVERARFEHELHMARQVQESLLPVQMPEVEGWSFGKCWKPAREVSGDFYDVLYEGGQKLSMVIADVTDKGMPASLFSVFTRTALRASIRQQMSPAETVAYTNKLICQDSHDGLFATLFYAQLESGTGEITYVNAGHNPPLFYSAQKDEIRLLERTGLTLGVELHEKYGQETIQLSSGDFILFYTDGITEAMNSFRQEFGLERLKKVVYDRRGETVEFVLDSVESALNSYMAPEQVFDDVTMLMVKRDIT
jgi:phosphoserine phosphatase RsbU/P